MRINNTGSNWWNVQVLPAVEGMGDAASAGAPLLPGGQPVGRRLGGSTQVKNQIPDNNTQDETYMHVIYQCSGIRINSYRIRNFSRIPLWIQIQAFDDDKFTAAS